MSLFSELDALTNAYKKGVDISMDAQIPETDVKESTHDSQMEESVKIQLKKTIESIIDEHANEISTTLTFKVLKQLILQNTGIDLDVQKQYKQFAKDYSSLYIIEKQLPIDGPVEIPSVSLDDDEIPQAVPERKKSRRKKQKTDENKEIEGEQKKAFLKLPGTDEDGNISIVGLDIVGTKESIYIKI